MLATTLTEHQMHRPRASIARARSLTDTLTVCVCWRAHSTARYRRGRGGTLARGALAQLVVFGVSLLGRARDFALQLFGELGDFVLNQPKLGIHLGWWVRGVFQRDLIHPWVRGRIHPGNTTHTVKCRGARWYACSAHCARRVSRRACVSLMLVPLSCFSRSR